VASNLRVKESAWPVRNVFPEPFQGDCLFSMDHLIAVIGTVHVLLSEGIWVGAILPFTGRVLTVSSAHALGELQVRQIMCSCHYALHSIYYIFYYEDGLVLSVGGPQLARWM
jgi:hypothetical protein